MSVAAKILFLFLSAVVLSLFLRRGPVQIETPITSCQKDTDCVLAKTNEWMVCDRGPCHKDYSEKGYMAMNKSWRDEKTSTCVNPFSRCTSVNEYLNTDSFVAQCISNTCQKTKAPFKKYLPPELPKKSVYRIFLLGDSMTMALGPHGGPFYDDIVNLYKNNNTGFYVDNYSEGSANIQAIKKLIAEPLPFRETTFGPMLSRNFDLIIVESFAYNPLSKFGLEGGLKMQNQSLDELLKNLITYKPESRIVFLATIAPNKENFAKALHPNGSVADRTNEANERIAYLKNHIAYANAHNIPVINIYEKSLVNGDGNLEYINPDDYIHPSAVGINFIASEMSKFIFDNQLIPH